MAATVDKEKKRRGTGSKCRARRRGGDEARGEKDARWSLKLHKNPLVDSSTQRDPDHIFKRGHEENGLLTKMLFFGLTRNTWLRRPVAGRRPFCEHNTSRLRFPTPNGRNKTSLSRRDL
jgi:hypothetical protein